MKNLFFPWAFSGDTRAWLEGTAALLLTQGLVLFFLSGGAVAQSTAAGASRPATGRAAEIGGGSEAPAPDLTRQPTLYVVGYAHLDTQWRWEYPQVIREFLPRTLRDNFALFEKYPHYIFNFSGANRYRLMKEYDPADYAKLRRYIAAGRWFPAGSSMEESDVNSPSAESLFRQILYGNEFFRREFGKASTEYMKLSHKHLQPTEGLNVSSGQGKSNAWISPTPSGRFSNRCSVPSDGPMGGDGRGTTRGRC